MAITKCLIYVGGLGTRLGSLTADIPKPLLPTGSRPFLDALLQRAVEHGIQEVVLLAGRHSDRVIEYAENSMFLDKLKITVMVEDHPLGTAGALKNAQHHINGNFLLMNGDSLFDFIWTDLTLPVDTVAAVALREIEDNSRYGTAELVDDRITGFTRGGSSKLVNGGVYLMDETILDLLPEIGSLEDVIFPMLAERGILRGEVKEGFFLDIGVPESYQAAQSLIPTAIGWPIT